MHIAIFNSLSFHYEMFGYIIDYCLTKNIKLDIFTEIEQNNEWFLFYLKHFKGEFYPRPFTDFFSYFKEPPFFPSVVKSTLMLPRPGNIDCVYDKIILLTDDDPYFNVFAGRPNVISIDHHEKDRNNFKKKIGTRPFPGRPNLDWTLPVYKIISFLEKKMLKKRGKETAKNIVILGGTHNDIKKNSDRFPSDYNLIFINRKRYFIYNPADIPPNCEVHYDLPTPELINILKKSAYIFISDNNLDHIDKSMSSSIALGLNCLCTIIMPAEMNVYYNLKSAITYKFGSPDKINLKESSLKSINMDLEEALDRRNYILDKFILN